MGEQLLLARFVGFDNENRHRRFPDGFKLSARFEVSTKTVQRSIDCFRNRLQAPLAYVLSLKGDNYAGAGFQLPVARLLAEKFLNISHEPSTSLGTGSVSTRFCASRQCARAGSRGNSGMKDFGEGWV